MVSAASAIVRFPGNLWQVDSVTDLRTLDSSSVEPKRPILASGGEVYGDGQGGAFTWDPGSSLDDNDATVIRPNDRTPSQVGRWLLIGSLAGRGPRGLPGGDRSDIGLLTDLATMTIPAGIFLIQTEGNSVTGQGPGLYINDALATSGLASAHPMFCKPDALGRYFRLLPDDGGLVAIAAAVTGTVTENNSVNHLPGIRAALAYSGAINAKGIRAQRGRHYSIWNSLNQSGTFNYNKDTTGCPLVFTAATTIEGDGAYFHRRAPNGGDPTNVANFPSRWSYNPGGPALLWRGGMFLQQGQPRFLLDSNGDYVLSGGNRIPVAAPANFEDRWHVTIRNLKIFGGIPRGLRYTGADPTAADPDGWDISDKFWCQNPDSWMGDFTLENVFSDGFRGEMLYGAPDPSSRWFLNNVRMSNTNAQTINPNGAQLQIDNFFGETAGYAVEGFGRGRIRGTFKDCANGGYFQGGIPAPSGSYDQPTRPPSGEIPMVDWDARFLNCGAYSSATLKLGSWHTGRLYLQDTSFTFGGVSATSAFDINLRIEMVAELYDSMLGGISGSATPGAMTTDNITLDMVYSVTKVGKQTNKQFYAPMSWGGSLGGSVRIRVLAEPGTFKNAPSAGYAAPDFSPLFEWGDWAGDVNMSGTNVQQNIATTPLIAKATPIVAIFSGGTVSPFVMPTAFIQPSQRMRVRNIDSVHLYVEGTATGGGNVRAGGRVGIMPGSYVDFEYVSTFWVPISPPLLLIGYSANLTPGTAGGNIAINGVSDVITAAVTGARLGMKTSVEPVTGYMGDGWEIVKLGVSANDVVSFRIRNNTGAAGRPSANTFTAQAAWGQ